MKNEKSFVVYCLFALALVACSNSDPTKYVNEIIEPESLGDMELVKFSLRNTPVILGSNDAGVKASERPAMKVVLDYDFSIGKHEVTCGEFLSVMSGVGPYAAAVACEDDSMPVVNVNYFDAVLFANALSKKQGLDTAYVYVSVSFDDEGCAGLGNLQFDPATDGLRLPTEAEWVHAASRGWNVADGWTASNSGYALHEVCTLPANSAGICDMAGNAMEWVNDWLGSFRDTTVTNFVGASDGGNLGERVLKGGCFRHDASSVNYVSRGDVYAVTSATRAEYVGFRLAKGKIPDATWMSKNGAASERRFASLVDAVSVRALTRTYKTKLAFRDDVSGNLGFIDYSVAGLLVKEIEDTLQVYHPEISPDGERVAFCTKLEGVSGKSELYVRKLDESGKGLVKLDVESAAIPRWRVLENGDTVIVYVSDAGNNKDNDAFLSKSTWQVKFSDGKFGTPEKLFDGAYHGGISDDGRLAVTGARLLRARISESGSSKSGAKALDTVWYNGEQACNASLSKDGSNRTAFLDFASETGRKFVGKEYGTHEQLLVADSTGKLVGNVAAPEGYSFDHTEWVSGRTSGTPDMLVATLVNSAGAHVRVALVNVSDDRVVEILQGSEIWHPNVWVQSSNASLENTTLDPDSAGIYYSETGDDAAASLRYCMENLWTYRDTADVVVLGSSRPQAGLDPKLVKDHFVVNLSNVPNSMAISQYLFENYVLLHVKKLKYLVVSLDIDMWWKFSENSWCNFFYVDHKKYPGYVYDENHEFWIDGYPEGLLEMTQNSIGNDFYGSLFLPSRGFNPVECGGWESDNPSVDYDSTWFDISLGAYIENVMILESMIKIAGDHGITLIGMIFPQSPGYVNTGAYGRYGLRHSEANDIVTHLRGFEETYPNFVLMDENKMGQHDYSDDMASNRDHLCTEGAKQITSRLDSLLGVLESR